MKKTFLVLLISILSFNVFADFSVKESDEKLGKIMDSNGKIKIIESKKRYYISASDILYYSIYVKPQINQAWLDIKLKYGEKVICMGNEQTMEYNQNTNTLLIYYNK